MHDPELQELRRALARTHTGRDIYYPDALRDRLSAWAFRRRDEGVPWDMIAAELGCHGKHAASLGTRRRSPSAEARTAEHDLGRGGSRR
jgi:hypothetical protein